MVIKGKIVGITILRSVSGKRRGFFLLSVAVAVFVLAVSELVCGYVGNSLILFTEACHMAVDALSYTLNYVASLKKENETHHDSVTRLELFAAAFTIFTLILTIGFVFFEGVHRLSVPHTQSVDALMLTGNAAAALVFNTTFLIVYHYFVASPTRGGHGHSHGMLSSQSCSHSHSHAHHHDCHDDHAARSTCCDAFCSSMRANINMESAVWHVIGDFFHSFCAVATGISIMVLKPSIKVENEIDGIVSILLAVVLLLGTLALVKRFFSAYATYKKNLASE